MKKHNINDHKLMDYLESIIRHNSSMFNTSNETIPDIEKVKNLFAKCTNINLQNHYPHNKRYENFSTLIMAIVESWNEVAVFLIENDVDVNIVGKNGATALFFASAHGKTELVKLLLQKNAEVNAKYNSNHGVENSQWISTPLSIAVNKTYPEIVELLLKAGAELCLDAENKTNVLNVIEFTTKDKKQQILDMLQPYIEADKYNKLTKNIDSNYEFSI